jgi:dienelactone hydrolase
MTLTGGRLDFLAPHVLRRQLLRPGLVRLGLRLGVAQQLPAWARLQFTNQGVDPGDLDRVLRRISSLRSWVDEWESLGRHHEQGGRDALALGNPSGAARRFLAASAAYNFAQYVMFLDVGRKRALHESCVRSYAMATRLFDPPAEPFEVVFRRQPMRGYLRLPKGSAGPVPVAVMFNGTNAVKEEMHWWGEALLAQGIAVIAFDGPGLGRTFHRMSMVAEPRPVGTAILNQIETRPELDPDAVAFFGMSLGGYIAIRMAAHDRRVRAVAAVSPPYSAGIYWNVTLSAMRRELAALYDMDEREMSSSVDRITLEGALPELRCPLMVAGGGNDMITPGSEAWRIFDGSFCERELVYYPRGAHDCFNVLTDLRPRMVGWLARQLARHHRNGHRPTPVVPDADGWHAAEAVDPDFADALRGDLTPTRWNEARPLKQRTRSWPWVAGRSVTPEVIHRHAAATRERPPRRVDPHAPDTPDPLPA